MRKPMNHQPISAAVRNEALSRITPVRTTLERAAAIAVFSGVIEKAAERVSKAVVAQANTSGNAVVDANASRDNDMILGLGRFIEINPKDDGRFACSGCGQNFNTLKEVTNHAVAHNTRDGAGTQLPTNAAAQSWDRRRGFDAKSSASPNTQLPGNSSEQVWKSSGRSASERTRCGLPSHVNWFIDSEWGALPEMKLFEIKKFAAQLVGVGADKNFRDVFVPRLRKFAFLMFGE